MNLSKSIVTFLTLAFLSYGETLKINPADDLFTMAQISLSQAEQAKNPAKAKIEFASAETWFQKFLSSFPKDRRAPEAHYYLAISQTQLGKDEKALTSYKNYLSYQKSGKMSGVAALQIALNFFNNKEFTQATNYLNIAITNLPKGNSKVLAHYTRAICAQKSPQNRDNLRNDILYVLSQEGGKAYYEKCHFMLAEEYLYEKQGLADQKPIHT